MTRKTLLERLDSLVGWTGIPALSQQPPRRRPLRWPATVALVLAFGGAIIATMQGVISNGYSIGYAALMVGFAIGNFTNIFGPLKPPASLVERVDEWDRSARAQAYLVTFGVFAATVFVGLFVMLWAIAFAPTSLSAKPILILLFLLMTILTTTPTAYASWRWRWDDDR
ncbi:MAG: hypothetical protein GY736_17905 [Sphingomonas sp.]|uniref:hypothetical protein n=1 Tax=unclassified Sphingomonas TaxID=196159 RepID=UPI000F862E44|nr:MULTISPECIES: hypothetical protein [unclassified Sphingomonas]MCP4028162.1 hypothetical protein [Sphingomonas sp.]RUN74597.1 hypothetical protein EJC47_20780 [Sphingomonas sp. TF3]